jgi:imidazolonepropionase-like amidohydrolase
MHSLVLTHARVIDPTTGIATPDTDVIIKQGVLAVGGDTPVDSGTALDMGGRTVLPGLIDAHVHLCSAIEPGQRPYALANAARLMLEGGITTVRDLGSYGRELFDLRDAIGAGHCQGPRLVLCGQILSATCPGAAAFPGMYREADGPHELRRAVREQVRQGADLIKLMTTGALTVPAEDVHPTQLRDEEVFAVVDEAHRWGYRVASHAEGGAGIRQSVAAGVDTLEHGEMGYTVPDALATMAERGIVLVPTLSVFDAVSESDGAFPAWVRERAARLGEAARRTVGAARAAGVAVAMGADAGPHGANARELVRLADAGLTNAEAIAAGTSIAAVASGVDAAVGTMDIGMAADVLVVDGDPLSDISVLTDPARLWLVLQGGEPVAGTAADRLRNVLAGEQPASRG